MQYGIIQYSILKNIFNHLHWCTSTATKITTIANQSSMESTEPHSKIILSTKLKGRKECLEEAKKVLLLTSREYDNDNDNDNDNDGRQRDNTISDTSQVFVESLVELYDSLQKILSVPVQQSGSPSSPLEVIYSYRHYLRWATTTEADRDNNLDTDIDIDTARDLIDTEADLYRALWLTCLLLLPSITSTQNYNQNNSNIRNTSKGESNNCTTSTNNNKGPNLQTTIRQCQLLVGLLKQIKIRTKSKTMDDDGIGNDNDNDNGEDSNNSIWDDRIRELTNINNHNDTDDDDTDDDSLNILSFSKEQLEKEEQELLNMAATPIPVYTQQQQQQQRRPFPFSSLEDTNAIDINAIPGTRTIKPIRLLVGRLISTSPSSSSLNIPIELDDMGILRTASGPMDDNDNGNQWWWSLTSQSDVLYDNHSPNKIKITNTISTCTADVTTITLDVGRDGLLWRDQVSRVLTTTTGGYFGTVMEEQEGIKSLWPMDDVIVAQTKARNQFICAFRKGE